MSKEVQAKYFKRLLLALVAASLVTYAFGYDKGYKYRDEPECVILWQDSGLTPSTLHHLGNLIDDRSPNQSPIYKMGLERGLVESIKHCNKGFKNEKKTST